jgi:hypothetical protein
VRSLSFEEISKITVSDFVAILKHVGMTPPLSPDQYITVAQVAELLGVSGDTVRRHYGKHFSRLSKGRVAIRVSKLFEVIESNGMAA